MMSYWKYGDDMGHGMSCLCFAHGSWILIEFVEHAMVPWPVSMAYGVQKICFETILYVVSALNHTRGGQERATIMYDI